MIQLDVLALAKQLIEIPSVSNQANHELVSFVQEILESIGFSEIETLDYTDITGTKKSNFVAKKGSGVGGIAFCCHSDTVPGQDGDWEPWVAKIQNGNLIGRGSCDMKGQIAAAICACAGIDAGKQHEPIYFALVSDEEVGLVGSKFVTEQSKILADSHVRYGVITEPTMLLPVNAHKGYSEIRVESFGKSAHTSTAEGQSANLQLAKFLGEMAELSETVSKGKRFIDTTFDPPTCGFNIVFSDGDTAANVTASKSTATVSFRPMPFGNSEEILNSILDSATKFELEVSHFYHAPFFTPAETTLVSTACEICSVNEPVSVSFGTDGIHFQNCIEQLIVLGAGDISVAHTVGEWISIAELKTSADIYRELIRRTCC